MERKVYTKQTNWGNLRSDKPPKTTVMIYNSLIVFGVIILAFALLALLDEEMVELALCFIPAALLMGGLGFYGKKKILKEYDIFMNSIREKIEQEEAAIKKYQKEHPYPESEELFKKLRDNGVADLKSKANVARLKLFAENNGITMSEEELIKQFNLGKKYVERSEAKEKEQENRRRLNEIKKQEKELNAEYTRYAKYKGSNKSVQFCMDKIKEADEIIYQCEKDQESVTNGGEALYLSGKQKESSWAVHGGIASGIAGTAAGIAVAADVERRNQEKRQQNAQLLNSIAAMSAYTLEKIWARKRSAKEEKEYWQEKLEKSKNLLTEKMDPAKLVEMIRPTVKSYEITETGAVKMKVDVWPAEKLFICDDVDAVIDGSFKVLLKADGEDAGFAVCTLPYSGLACCLTLDCICCKPEKTAEKYTFDFVSDNLWALEKEKFF